jgi:hypothetical protein
MARSAPATPSFPAEGGTYELDAKTGALVCVQQTTDAPAEVSQEPLIIEDNASPDSPPAAACEV